MQVLVFYSALSQKLVSVFLLSSTSLSKCLQLGQFLFELVSHRSVGVISNASGDFSVKGNLCYKTVFSSKIALNV